MPTHLDFFAMNDDIIKYDASHNKTELTDLSCRERNKETTMDLIEMERTPVSRVERKRLQARARILEAAEELMRARGFDAVKIQDITDVADVGHGTFYTHFKTKMDVLVPIVRTKARQLTERLDELTRDMEDSADVVSISVRHMLTAIAKDPLWAWFLYKSDLPMDQIREASGESAKRDIQNGIETGRFIEHDEITLEPFLLGALAGVIRDKFETGLDQPVIENCAYILLLILGVEKEEARKLSCTPLPPLPTD
ncbi:MAG TPA: hypothetical protein DD437_04515 [Rhodobiaceae bacterium]|nr:hypothetical protein [Rhodobiaceae bacterium]|tara:strand:- start:4871 stop:5632 length:762 start_codon:yes stop_codon:yes gene_type:complete